MSKMNNIEEQINEIMAATGYSREYTEKELKLMRQDYNISPAKYIKQKLYSMPEEERYKRAEKIRKKENLVSKVAKEKGISRREAKEEIKAGAEKYDISSKEYVNKEYFKYEGEQQELYHKYLLDSVHKKRNYSKKVAEATGLDLETASKEIKRAKNLLAISAREYYVYKLYEKSEDMMLRTPAIKRRKEIRKMNTILRIGMACGKTKGVIASDLSYVRKKFTDVKIDLKLYDKLGLYKLAIPEEEETLANIIQKYKESIALRDEIKSKISVYRQGLGNYDEAIDRLDEYKEILAQILSEEWIEKLAGSLQYSIPEVIDDIELRHKVAIDLEATCSILSFGPTEYIYFHFWEMDFKSRLDYVSDTLRGVLLKQVNMLEGRMLLTNKYAAYSRLKKYYGRQIELFDGNSTYDDFKEYCEKHKHFVKKDNFESLGRGVIKVDINENTCIKNLYEEMTENGKFFIVEDLITAHKKIKRLNPDSINTVRIVTNNKNGVIQIEDVFMKIGRKGSFVDNGGAGGIFVHVDPKTGVFDSDGIDEKGIRYSTHPEHGYAFKGIKLPRFRKALKTAKAAAKEITEAGYIGWDLAYTEKREWLIVEGNERTQFFGQQGTIGKGCRKRFMASIGIDEIKAAQLIE